MNKARADAPPDLVALAKRFLDLWQEQLTEMAADPHLADGMNRFLAALPPGFPFGLGRAGDAPKGAARPAAAAPAPDERDELLVECAHRLDAIERRLARLETGPAAKRRAPPGKPRKRTA